MASRPRRSPASWARLKDSDAEVVLEAIDALEFVGDENVLADLRRLLDHPNPEVREAAQDAIEYLQED